MHAAALVIDLDGTLTSTDMLYDGLFDKLASDPPGFFELFRICGAARRSSRR
ncbi:MAG: hypothetical protein N2444_09465 [Methylocystis sp.]|nr:hypothetical protein [Methylocystis sp.]